MVVWVTRDKANSSMVAVWDCKGEDLLCNFYGQYELEGDSKGIEIDHFYMESRFFKQRFGFTPKKGSCEEMEMTLTRIEK